jgi:hypothetical protein
MLMHPMFGRFKGNVDVDLRGDATKYALFPFPAISSRLIFVPFRLPAVLPCQPAILAIWPLAID